MRKYAEMKRFGFVAFVAREWGGKRAAEPSVSLSEAVAGRGVAN